jgi:aryl-alcohol dehydrogenase-like predicted oxidoreductase
MTKVLLLLFFVSAIVLLQACEGGAASFFFMASRPDTTHTKNAVPVVGRRSILLQAGMFSGMPFFGGGGSNSDERVARAAAGPPPRRGGGPLPPTPPPLGSKGAGTTNEVVKVVDGVKRRRLGGSDIFVSEMGLGTQRWVSGDFNAPDKAQCYAFLDEATRGGINLIDTAEQYPIPSNGRNAKEGDTELLIGDWMRDRRIPRSGIVISTKMTGGRNVTPRNIRKDCEGSLQRLGTDYIDVYLLHWPQRYSPQSNWGQSLKYNIEEDASTYWRGSGGPTTFEELCVSMQELIDAGMIRGWGLCNDNAYGLTAASRTAKGLGTTPPCTLQGDFSILDRKSEENGVAEAASPFNENVGFMSYNALAGGMLTGKYLDIPAAVDDPDRDRGARSLENPRGRMDTRGWGGTLYRYRTEAAQEAIREYAALARANQMSLTELCLRWNRQRDLVTTTLLGHTNIDQLRERWKFLP